MEQKATRYAWLMVASLAIPLLSLGAYLGCYLLRDKSASDPDLDPTVIIMTYASQREASFFGPAAKVESRLTGKLIVTWPDLSGRRLQSGHENSSNAQSFSGD